MIQKQRQSVIQDEAVFQDVYHPSILVRDYYNHLILHLQLCI